MSIRSTLRERAGPQVRIRAVDPVPSGSSVRLRLLTGEGTPDTVDAARILARRHLSLRKAHAALTKLLEAGSVVLDVPVVEDVKALTDELRTVGIIAHRHEPPRRVDVGELRARSGLSQEEFALVYGLDVATVRNWEQGRSQPDTASRAYLWMIQRRPELVLDMLDTEVE